MAVQRQSMPAGLIDHFRAEITAGRLKAGDRLPPGHEIAKLFNVSIPTARAATTALAALGLAEIRRGKGVYIAAPPPQPLQAPGGPVLIELAARETSGDRCEVLHAGLAETPQHTAAELDTEPGSMAILREVAITAAGQTAALLTSWFPASLAAAAPQLLQMAPLPLHIDGFRPARGQDWVTARMPGTVEARLLATTRWQPLVAIASRRYDAVGRVVEYTELVARAGMRVAYRYECPDA
jgi:DNA-binding GntR family transcriptional regulator